MNFNELIKKLHYHQKLCLLIGLVVITFLLLFPPHVAKTTLCDRGKKGGFSPVLEVPIGYFFIFQPPDREEISDIVGKSIYSGYDYSRVSTSGIDITRLYLQISVILVFVIISFAIVTVRKEEYEQKEK